MFPGFVSGSGFSEQSSSSGSSMLDRRTGDSSTSHFEVSLDGEFRLTMLKSKKGFFYLSVISLLQICHVTVKKKRTKFDKIDTHNELAYISGEIYYANWPMIVSKKGNQKMFLDVEWEHPFEQTWMSYMFQETIKGNLNPAVLLASPVWHNRIVYYKPEERREN
jgi:hypothetical protein